LAATPLLRVEVQQETTGTVVIRCTGELDLSNCDELREAINWSFTRDLAALRLDLTGLTFFDSTGVTCLIECNESCTTHGVDLEIAPRPMVAKVLALLDFDSATQARILPPTPSAPTEDSGATSPANLDLSLHLWKKP
jgi:anti-sigma B factor antagonist